MNQNLVATKERLNEEQQTLTEKLENLLADNKYNIHVLNDTLSILTVQELEDFSS